MGTYNTETTERKEYQLAPVGTHAARIYAVAEIGYHKNFFEPEKKPKNLLLLLLELVNTSMDSGLPFGQYKEYPISFYDGSGAGSPAGLYLLCNSLLGGRPPVFTPKMLLGLPCLAVVALKDKQDGGKKTVVTSILAVPDGYPVKAPVNELVLFDINSPDGHQLSKLPPWVQKKISEAIVNHDEVAGGFDESDVPF